MSINNGEITMAKRRMFAMTIVDSDAFLDMPLSTQALYFHLNMRADDDGFTNNPKKIMRMIGASEDEFKVLIAKKFIISFESGVVVIKHWRIHNLFRKDRHQETIYAEELTTLEVKDNGGYTQNKSECKPNGNQIATSGCPSIVKSSIVKSSIVNIYSPEDYKEIISHLNQITSSNYRLTSSKTKDLITARMNDGFVVDDFKRVHMSKYAEWTGTEFEKYLRPITLYGNKFESYLNQNITDYEKMKVVSNHTGLSPLEMLKQQGYAS